MLTIFKRFNVFSERYPKDILQNIATKDMVNNEIQESLLQATELGQQQVLTFVSKRLIPSETELKTSFNDAIKRCKAMNFDSLYEVPKNVNDKEK